jgi:hypothetical protein
MSKRGSQWCLAEAVGLDENHAPLPPLSCFANQEYFCVEPASTPDTKRRRVPDESMEVDAFFSQPPAPTPLPEPAHHARRAPRVIRRVTAMEGDDAPEFPNAIYQRDAHGWSLGARRSPYPVAALTPTAFRAVVRSRDAVAQAQQAQLATLQRRPPAQMCGWAP